MIPRLVFCALLVLSFNLLQAQPPSVSLRTSLLHSMEYRFQEAPPESLGYVGTRSPALATVLSTIAPGAGQIYAERYWTIPVIWGFGYWFVRNYIQLDRKYNEWSSAYTLSLQQGIYAGSGDPYIKSLRDFYHNERDRFAFYLALTYVLNIVDAYVGASLYGFDVGEDLGGGQNMRAEIRIPIR